MIFNAFLTSWKKKLRMKGKKFYRMNRCMSFGTNLNFSCGREDDEIEISINIDFKRELQPITSTLMDFSTMCKKIPHYSGELARQMADRFIGLYYFHSVFVHEPTYSVTVTIKSYERDVILKC